MKTYIKGFVLAFTMLASSVTSANDFSEKYPHAYDFLANWYASAKVGVTISTESILIDELKKHQADKATKALLKKYQSELPCLKKFDNHQVLEQEQLSLLKNLSKSELDLIENYYASEAGQAEIYFGKKALTAMFSGDINALEAMHKEATNPTYQAINKKIHQFEADHQAIFDKYHQALNVPSITQISDDYIYACSTQA